MKYFLFYGCDLSSPKEDLKFMVKLGHCLIPLDPDAIGYALEFGFEFKTIDDIISQEEIMFIRDQAESISENWFKAFKNEFTSNGICWPEFDQMAMYWSWNDRLIISKLLEKLDQPDAVFSLVNVKYNNLRPAVFAYPTASTSVVDGVKTLICDTVKNKIVIYNFTGSEPATLRTKAKKLISGMRRTFHTFFTNLNRQDGQLKKKGLDVAAMKGKITFVDLEDDFYRAKHLIHQIKSQFNDQLILCPIVLFNNKSLSEWQQIADKTNSKVVCLPTDFKIDERLGTRLYRAYENAVENLDDVRTKQVFTNLSFQFKYYCHERWPLLDAYYTYLSHTFKSYRPLAVIVSNLDSAETQLPGLAANRLNIPTFAVPHGGVGRCKLNLQSAMTIFYGSELIRKNSIRNTDHSKLTLPKKKLVITPGMITERNNLVSSGKVNYDQSKLKVLVLTSTIGINQLILPFVLARAQISILREISRQPKHIERSFQILIRPRPGNLDLKMYQNIGLGNMLVSNETELDDNILNSDLIVALNNYQTSLSQAIKFHKPIIMLTNDKSLFNWKMMSYSDKYEELGGCIRDANELWACLENIQRDNTILEVMKKKTEEFHKKYWDTSNLPTIADVILHELESTSIEHDPSFG